MIPILNAIISILYVFIWIYIYLYITKLEKIGCECSNDWKRSYIKYYILIILLFIILIISYIIILIYSILSYINYKYLCINI